MFFLYSLKRNILYTNCSSALMSSLFSEDCALHDKPANPSRAFRYQHDFPRRVSRVAERIGTRRGNKKYRNMKHLEAAPEDASLAG